jgi:hypothetical protein
MKKYDVKTNSIKNLNRFSTSCIKYFFKEAIVRFIIFDFLMLSTLTINAQKINTSTNNFSNSSNSNSTAITDSALLDKVQHESFAYF